MRHQSVFVLAILAFSLIFASPASAERRLALVIGNSSYQSVTALPNPANDAQAVSELLTSAGFEVVMASDLSRVDMRRAIREFAAKAAESGPDTVTLVYYAGHGVQIDGENFLVPIDAKIEHESDVTAEAYRLADLMKALDAAPSKMRIVMLDACRNNPFSSVTRVAGRGLAIVDAPTGSIVAYATAPGTEADDGAGRHSPYTAALLKIAKQPGMPIEQVLKRVRVLVHEATDGRQTPWESSSLTGDFAFFITPGQAAANPPPFPLSSPITSADLQPKLTRVAARKEQIRTRPPREAYEMVVEEDDIELYEEFIVLYPVDPLAERIRRILAQRLEVLAWRNAVVANTPAAYETYLAAYSEGNYANEAFRLRVRPRERSIDPLIVRPAIAPVPQVRVALPAPVVRPVTINPPIVRPAPVVTLPVTSPTTLPVQPGTKIGTPSPVGPVTPTPVALPPGAKVSTPTPSGPVTPTPVALPPGAKVSTPTPSGPVTPTPVTLPPGAKVSTPTPSGPVTPTPETLPPGTKVGSPIPTGPGQSPKIGTPSTQIPGQPPRVGALVPPPGSVIGAPAPFPPPGAGRPPIPSQQVNIPPKIQPIAPRVATPAPVQRPTVAPVVRPPAQAVRPPIAQQAAKPAAAAATAKKPPCVTIAGQTICPPVR